MSVNLEDDIIRLQGQCGVEEAERFLVLLQETPGRRVNLARADNLHTALVQIIMALRPQLIGECGDVFVREWVIPKLAAPDAGNGTGYQVFDSTE
jgi:hypothetical protein